MLTLEEQADENCRVWKEGSGSETDVWPSTWGIKGKFFYYSFKIPGQRANNIREGRGEETHIQEGAIFLSRQ